MATLGLGDREVLREGIACAVLAPGRITATPTTPCSTCGFPPALGARAVVLEDEEGGDAGDDSGLPPDDVEAMRQMLLDLLNDNPELADMDERLVAMIARIVEAYGKYNSSRGPSFSSYQALKAMALGRTGGQAAGGAAGPLRRRADAHPGADRQSACCAEDYAAAQNGRRRDQAAHRRAARPRSRPDVRHPTAFRERRVPARLRRAAAPDAPGGGAAGPHAGDPAGGPSAPHPRRDDRSAQDAAQVDVHRRCADRRGAGQTTPGAP